MHKSTKCGCYECVGEKVNLYQCNLKIMTVINQISECIQLLKIQLNGTNGRTFRVDTVKQVLADANKHNKREHKEKKTRVNQKREKNETENVAEKEIRVLKEVLKEAKK